MRKGIMLFILPVLLFFSLFSGIMREAATAQETLSKPKTMTFQSFDLWIESGSVPLTAYQVEITYDVDTVTIVGVEGGEAPVYQDPPYYDEQGFSTGRIIVAAFTTNQAGAPKGESRVARLHFAVTGKKRPFLQTQLMAAAKPGGERIQVRVKLAKAIANGE